MNSAFVFIKPHAVTDTTIPFVKEELTKHGINILTEGDLTSDVIDKKKLIDQHYYAIASKATILKPNELNVPKDKFKEQFGLEWDEALSQGVVYNAMDACSHLGVDAEKLSEIWGKAKKDGQLVKFGGGFYCGKVTMEGKDPIYVFNGFFMSMRAAFTAPNKRIHYFSVEFDEGKLSWEDFRNKVLGPTDPATAPADSLRGQILAKWKEFGLASEPNVGDNGVHASASPFEGLAERMNWLETPCTKDPYGQRLLEAGLDEATIKAWSVDPQVTIEGNKKGSLFDQLEDMNATPCLRKVVALKALQ